MEAAYRETLQRIASMYSEGATQLQIATAIGLSQTKVSRLMRKHGIKTRSGPFTASHGMYGSAEYRAWQNMKNRCFNSKVASYRTHGGRGITVCPQWRDSFGFDISPDIFEAIA